MKRVLSLFSGAKGFDLGFEWEGFKTVAYCEWDEKAQDVLRFHSPETPLFPDVRTLHISAATPHLFAHVVTFGSPCQDLSVAGNRAGLTGQKSSLFHEATRIIQEMREASNNGFPEFAVWENVPGAFSSNGGRDFAAVLAGLAGCGALDIGWRVLDSQLAGVPQRRKRIFLVADFRGKRSRQVLFERQGLRGYPQEGRGQREETSAIAGERLTGSSGNTSACLLTKPRIDAERETFVNHERLQPAYSLDCRNHEANLEVSGTLQAKQTGGYSLNYQNPVAEPIALDWGNSMLPFTRGVSPTLIAGGSAKDAGRGRIAVTEPIALEWASTLLPTGEGISPTLVSGGNSNGRIAVTEPLTVDLGPQGQRIHMDARVSQTLSASDGGLGAATGLYAAAPQYRVRRLTPRECERLQGWPDDHTLWGKKPDGTVYEMPDTHRYRMCGNGVTATVSHQIAERIKAVLA